MIVYRIEHIDSGLGPFHHGLSQTTRDLLTSYWDKFSNPLLKFPPPDQDPIIQESKHKLNSFPKNSEFKFACYSKDAIYDWIGIDCTQQLLKEGFIIKEYRLNIDFFHYIDGTNQIMIAIE